ncbi:FadR/GntR family transcriptional regulator [Tritonibacter mobilis]|uniref:FadR/GntR family transcriptional regulator n=1 Tax=Tritonibacter mobilis TaxID=379347 RepID=UPI00089C569C|nr:FCD domain-containing protein [Tritonibacter mobilis]GLP85728.1 GntR family transcriptional regulator [Tritonibacter mobilis]SDX84760.1 transcriptional regulator, GntR family [Tritonibacter mobilis]
MTQPTNSNQQTHTQAAGETLETLPPGSTSRDVLDALSRMIDREGLRIGDRLPPEVNIARRLGISRAKVREALTSWQSMGIVVRNKKAGTRLAAEVAANAIHLPVTMKLEAESLLRTHAVRRPLEVEAVRLAAQNRTPKHAAIITARVSELMAVYDAGEDWRPADDRFHRAIYDACGNPLFEQLILQIQQGFKEVYEAPLGKPHLGHETIPLHPLLAQAIAEGNETEATRLMEEILTMVEAEIRQVLETKND